MLHPGAPRDFIEAPEKGAPMKNGKGRLFAPQALRKAELSSDAAKK